MVGFLFAAGAAEPSTTGQQKASLRFNPNNQQLLSAITSVEVTWPATGERQVFQGLERDQTYPLKEGTSAAVAIQLKRTEFDVQKKVSHRHRDQAGL